MFLSPKEKYPKLRIFPGNRKTKKNPGNSRVEILWSQPYSIKYRSFQNYKDLLYIFSNAAKCKDFLNFIMNGSFQQRDLKIVSWQHKRGLRKKVIMGFHGKIGSNFHATMICFLVCTITCHALPPLASNDMKLHPNSIMVIPN